MLHVLNGDSLVAPFEEAGLEGEVLVWREILSEGPTILDTNELFSKRQAFLQAYANESNTDYQQKVVNQYEQMLESTDEVTLWFEHDLVCQVNLFFLLHALNGDKVANRSIYLVCIDRHSSVPSFKGLSQLNGSMLAAIYHDKIEMTAADFFFASELWQYYCDSDAVKLNDVINVSFNNLKFARNALIAHLQRFPFSSNGLNKIERKIINYANTGVHDAQKMMKLMLATDKIYGLTDLSIEWYLKRLKPLFSSTGNLELNEFGEKAYLEEFDFLKLKPEPYSLGGAKNTDFRWNDTTKKLEASTG